MSDRSDRQRRILPPVALLSGLIFTGGGALWLLGRGRWKFADTLYLAVNAVSTVGFREVEGLDQVRFARVVTVAMILAGLGTVAYFQSSLTALLVQGVIGERFRMTRMQKRIDDLEGHLIVCGAGATGVHVIEELYATKAKLVVVDRNREVLERISREVCNGDLLFVVGNATEDQVLTQAGVARAAGVVAALTEDKDNLYVTLSARTLNANARIVTKVVAHDAQAKMLRAGANATVSPNMIGGRRLASELVRPTVVEFMDQMLHDKQDILRLEEVALPARSPFIGKTIREVPIRSETKLLVVALKIEGKFLYNPDPGAALEAGSVLVVLGPSDNVQRLRKMVAEETA